MNITIRVGFPGVPMGATTKYHAWKTQRGAAYLEIGNASVIVATTRRLVSWRSGNFASRDGRIADAFLQRWNGLELLPQEAVRLIPSRVPGHRAVKLALRDAVYSDDTH